VRAVTGAGIKIRTGRSGGLVYVCVAIMVRASEIEQSHLSQD
jgi:hypothetical protein